MKKKIAGIAISLLMSNWPLVLLFREIATYLALITAQIIDFMMMNMIMIMTLIMMTDVDDDYD